VLTRILLTKVTTHYDTGTKSSDSYNSKQVLHLQGVQTNYPRRLERFDPLNVKNAEGVWRPVRESNPCRRREREAIYILNSKENRGMDSTVT
jgi:hypothetical protein